MIKDGYVCIFFPDLSKQSGFWGLRIICPATQAPPSSFGRRGAGSLDVAVASNKAFGDLSLALLGRVPPPGARPPQCSPQHSQERQTHSVTPGPALQPLRSLQDTGMAGPRLEPAAVLPSFLHHSCGFATETATPARPHAFPSLLSFFWSLNYTQDCILCCGP